jgi:hypothetical protein
MLMLLKNSLIDASEAGVLIDSCTKAGLLL